MIGPLYSQWLEINHPEEHQNSAEEDHRLEEFFIQQAMNNQEDLVQVEIINSESTNAMEPANLVDHSELSYKASTCSNCRVQFTSEHSDEPTSTAVVSAKDSMNADECRTNLTTGTSPCTVAVPPPEHEGEFRYVYITLPDTICSGES